MKNNIITIMKKECVRLFSDKRLFLMAVVMPGLLIYLMYTLMGNFMGDIFSVSKDYKYQIYAIDMPESISMIMTEMESSVDIINASEADIELLKQRISDKEIDLLIKFPVDFDGLVAAFDITTATQPAPNIQIWSNMARTESSSANGLITSVLNNYQYSISHKFTINAITEEILNEEYNLATDADMFATFSVFIFPMLLMMFIFTGCQAIAPESIAGEKERGTLGTLLVTPTKRSDIAIAKILSITIFGVLSMLGSFLGLILSLPKLMQMDSTALNFYTIKDYAMIFIVGLTTALVFVSVLSILSAYAKSVKEATAYAMPLMFVSMVFGLSGMLTGGALNEIYYYFIPVFNSAQSLTAIFEFQASMPNILVTVATNIVCVLICTFVLTKMFNSEKIVFDS